MKKWIYCAIWAVLLAGCYTPLNNSGVATTKPWLEISGRKNDFEGRQYDSCYRFNVRFWPQEAANELDLQKSCITACCWRSDKEEVTLDFNKNFEKNLARYGQARQYTPGKITLKVNHSNWLNTTKVSVSPKGTITNNGLIKLSYRTVDNPTRIAQLKEQERQTAARPVFTKTAPVPDTKTVQVKTKTVTKTYTQTDPAKALVQRVAGPKIDSYFYDMNKRYNKQGAVFLLSERLLHVQPADENTAIVSCTAKARTGLDAHSLNASTFPCGQWLVDTTTETVTPYDKRAQLIWGM